MGMHIVTGKHQGAASIKMYTLSRKVYTDPACTKVVDENTESKIVLGNKGQKINAALAQKLGLMARKTKKKAAKKKTARKSRKKATKPAEDKNKEPAEDKKA